MERVTRSSALPELPARPDVEGNPGFFGPGDKTTGTPASVPGYEWFNMVQEELCNVVSELGADELSGASYNQVAQAILHAISQAVPDSIDWGNVLNKPATFPPSGHGHAWSEITDKPATYTPNVHTHTFEQVPGLQSALDAIETIPVGTFAYFIGPTPPDGWLVCNGAALSRTAYADLFEVISQAWASGANWGNGDGVTNFYLPDLRGAFIRGFDGGRGVDVGRTFGVWQMDEIRAHKHDMAVNDSGGYNATETNFKGSNVDWNPSSTMINTAVIQDAGGAETRPQNVALLPCVKY